MTYITGTNGLGGLGIADGPPRLRCDSCGHEQPVVGRGFATPPAWLLDKKAPRGWAYTRDPWRHTCPECRKQRTGDDHGQ